MTDADELVDGAVAELAVCARISRPAAARLLLRVLAERVLDVHVDPMVAMASVSIVVADDMMVTIARDRRPAIR